MNTTTLNQTLDYFNNLQKETRDKCADKYRELLLLSELGNTVDWEYINKFIIDRWSISGLTYIKNKAWMPPRKNNKRIYVTAKNMQLEWGVFLISINDFWSTFRVGFSDYESAMAHVENIKSSSRA